MRTLLVALAALASGLSLIELVHVCERLDAREQAERARDECERAAARCEELVLESCPETNGGKL